MRRVLASASFLIVTLWSQGVFAADPNTGATDAVTLHHGQVVAAMARGLYRWDGTDWALWHTWSLRGVNRTAITAEVDGEASERLRAFEEVVEELVPTMSEAEAEATAEEMLGYARPRPQLVLGDGGAADGPHRAILAMESYRGFLWVCAVDGVYRVGDAVTRLSNLGDACTDLVVGPGLLVAATERGFYKMVQPGDWLRIAGQLPGLLVGMATNQGRVYAAASDGVYELAERPVRISGISVEAIGQLGERLAVLRDGQLAYLGDDGLLEQTGTRIAGIALRAGDGQYLVSSDELWTSVMGKLRWVPLSPHGGELRDVLDYGGLWVATSAGMILPRSIAEDRMMKRLGDVLKPSLAAAYGRWIDEALDSRGLEVPDAPIVSSRWLPELTFSFKTNTRRGVGVRDLEALAETLDIDPEDIDPDLVDSEREWRNDLVDASWRAMVTLTWRPDANRVASASSRMESVRYATVQERRRVSKRAARTLAGYLATERRMILYPPRTVRSAVRRLIQIKTKRALLEGLLDQELP